MAITEQPHSRADLVISFLGKPFGGYKITRYVYEDKSLETPFCTEAIVAFFQPTHLLVMTTPSAMGGKTGDRLNLEWLLANVQDLGVKGKPVEIPEDGTTEALWSLFDILVKASENHSRVILDVTYGFRYIPMLALLASQFLRVSASVQSFEMYYGLYDPNSSSAETPILNLQQFDQLMAWSAAATHFERTGNAAWLVEQMTGQDPLSKTLREQLQAISEGLRLGQARQIGRNIQALELSLAEASDSASISKPMRAILGAVTRKYRELSLPADSGSEALADLRQQANLLQWYVHNGQILQAWLLAREWLVSWMMFQEGGASNLYQHSQRNKYASRLNNAAKASVGKDLKGKKQSSTDNTGLDQVLALWSSVRDLRNKMAHMSMSDPGGEIQTITDETERLAREIENLARQL